MEFWYYFASMPTVTIKLGGEDYQLLKSEAERRGTTHSEVLREGLRRVTLEAEPKSIRERMQDLLGSVEGPEDLATNPEHLKDYGF